MIIKIEIREIFKISCKIKLSCSVIKLLYKYKFASHPAYRHKNLVCDFLSLLNISLKTGILIKHFIIFVK